MRKMRRVKPSQKRSMLNCPSYRLFLLLSLSLSISLSLYLSLSLSLSLTHTHTLPNTSTSMHAHLSAISLSLIWSVSLTAAPHDQFGLLRVNLNFMTGRNLEMALARLDKKKSQNVIRFSVFCY